jgi:hypothetical protein
MPRFESVRHARVVHVQDEDAVVFLPAEFLSVRCAGLSEGARAGQQDEQEDAVKEPQLGYGTGTGPPRLPW